MRAPQWVTILRDPLPWEEGGIRKGNRVEFLNFLETLIRGYWHTGMEVEIDEVRYTVQGCQLIREDGEVLGVPQRTSTKLVLASSGVPLRGYTNKGRGA